LSRESKFNTSLHKLRNHGKNYITVDMGNTRIKIGFFDKGRLVNLLVWKGIEDFRKQGFIAGLRGATVIVSSVHDDKNLLELLSDSADKYYYLTQHTPTPVRTLYKTPDTLGKDRIAAVVGAHAAFPDKNILVFDIGTCMTYDLIDQGGTHRGGNIAPGLHLRYRSMHEGTAKLPRVNPRLNGDILGVDTISALQNGGLFGLICEIEGIATRIAKEFRNFGLVLTGGDAELIGNQLSIPYQLRPNLVLEGLYEIAKYNEH